MGMQTSSVQPGYTVDSYTTTSPFLSTLPTVSLERSSGVRSGPVVLIDRRRDRDDEDPALAEILEAGGIPELARGPQFRGRALERAVAALLQFGDAIRLDVEPHRVEVLAELHRQRQTHIAESDHADTTASHAQFHDFSVLF